MKKFVIALIAISLVAGLAIAEKPKEMYMDSAVYVGDGASRQGGEDIDSAVEITDLPYTDTGSTVGYADDYDVTGLDSADVVYSYTPALDTTFEAALCGSAYDTKLAIITADLTVIAYNDDGCNTRALQSSLADVALTGGVTYYIIVDGYNGNEGDYELYVDGVAATPPGPGETCDNPVAATEGLNSCPGATFFYSFTAPIDGTVLIDSCIEGQSIDTYVYVNNADCSTLLDLNDDSDGCESYDYASFIELPVTAGQEIIIEWDDAYSSEPFDFNLWVTDGTVATDETTFDSLKSMYR